MSYSIYTIWVESFKMAYISDPAAGKTDLFPESPTGGCGDNIACPHPHIHAFRTDCSYAGFLFLPSEAREYLVSSYQRPSVLQRQRLWQALSPL